MGVKASAEVNRVSMPCYFSADKGCSTLLMKRNCAISRLHNSVLKLGIQDLSLYKMSDVKLLPTAMTADLLAFSCLTVEEGV